MANKLGDVKPEALVEALSCTLAETTTKVTDTLGDVETKAHIVALGDALAVVETRTLGDTLGNV